jgi:hypothetical protein
MFKKILLVNFLKKLYKFMKFLFKNDFISKFLFLKISFVNLKTLSTILFSEKLIILDLGTLYYKIEIFIISYTLKIS